MDERTRSTEETLRRPPPGQEVRPRASGRYRVGLVVVALLILGAGYALLHWTRSTGQPGRFPQGGGQTVGAATVANHDIRVIVNALGTVTPIATITLQTQISGQLVDVSFNEGQMVKKGDTLAQIDARPYALQQAQYEGQLAHDQGLLAQSQLDLARYQKLADQNSIARQQYEDQVFVVQQAQGTVKLDEALVDQQKLNVSYCRIVSPITGRVGLRLVDPGNYVQTSTGTGIAVITQLQPITVIFSIPEDELPQIMPQYYAATPLEVTAYDRANIHEIATGTVAAVDSQIDTTTGTVKVRAQFDNKDNALFPNQFVNARLLVKTIKDAVTVPTSAILRGAPGAYVYVINSDNTVSMRQIATGAVDGSLTQVESGLTTGERVVVDGTDRLRDGLRVTVASENGQPRAPAGTPGGRNDHAGRPAAAPGTSPPSGSR